MSSIIGKMPSSAVARSLLHRALCTASPSPSPSPPPPPPPSSSAKEKTVFDVKLERYEAGVKLKLIKEIRSFTGLGLREAKELVEKTPAVLKKGVTKDEADKIVAKLYFVSTVLVVE